uniref:Bm13106 n=1 Tax=Brugia malayi TaxID=6279 RepID=A0A1I9G2M6_BRUMA|nr:Bm13106 [Brugia malayi]
MEYSLGVSVQSSILQENETFMRILLACLPLLVVSYMVIKQGNEQLTSSPKFYERNEPCKLLFDHSVFMRICLNMVVSGESVFTSWKYVRNLVHSQTCIKH